MKALFSNIQQKITPNILEFFVSFLFSFCTLVLFTLKVGSFVWMSLAILSLLCAHVSLLLLKKAGVIYTFIVVTLFFISSCFHKPDAIGFFLLLYVLELLALYLFIECCVFKATSNTVQHISQCLVESTKSIAHDISNTLQGADRTRNTEDDVRYVDLEEQKEKLRQELFLARQELSKVYQENNNLQKELLKNIKVCQTNAKVIENDQIDQANNFRPQYIQLREQFQEKSQMLDETRKTLFKLEEELTIQKRANDELHTAVHTSYDAYIHSLIKEIEVLEIEREKLFGQLGEYEKLIYSLLSSNV